MNINDYAQTLLLGPSLKEKLLGSNEISDFSLENRVLDLPKFPGRNDQIAFSDIQLKFPKKTALKNADKKAQAIHAFANHELLAIEMMAAFILCVPHQNAQEEKAKKAVVKTICDEQKHLKLYINRLHSLGYEFGDFPLNSFFWSKMPVIKTASEYFAIMALTFEAANLDFAYQYMNIFHELEDSESAKTMEIVYQDEISHVALGAFWLNQWKKDIKLWEYYKNILPDGLTPARSKGVHFNFDARIQSGLDQEFVEKAQNYRDDFQVTNRKSWDF